MGRATVHLKFGVSLFSTRFSFKVDRHVVEERSVELRYVEGEPRDLNIRFDVVPASVAEKSVLYVGVRFDVFSLGWLAKYFLKNHPEIRNGVYPGSAFTLLDTMARAAEGR
jgi:hypothetical protein